MLSAAITCPPYASSTMRHRTCMETTAMADFDIIYVQETQFRFRFGTRFTVYIAQLGIDQFQVNLYWHLDNGLLQQLRVSAGHSSATQAFEAAVREIARYEKIKSDPIEEVVNPCHDPLVSSRGQ